MVGLVVQLSRVVLVVGVAVAGVALGEVTGTNLTTRTWTSVNGNQIEASFLREEGGVVFLQRPDGTLIKSARDRLSPNDLLWIDKRGEQGESRKSESFTKATLLETTKMEHYKLIRRMFLKTYADLTNNDRDDKALAFLERDARSIFGWAYIASDCYLTKSGKRGKLRTLKFVPQAPIPLREAVQMARDKFSLVMPDPVVVREIYEDGETFWELQSPPPFVARALLLVDSYSKNIRRFDFHFPPPDGQP